MSNLPSLFDQLGETATSTTSDAPKAGGGTVPPRAPARKSPLVAFRDAVRMRRRSGEEVELHPRLDQMWLSRRDDIYFLSTHRGRYEYRFDEAALHGLVGMLDVSGRLMSRLRSMPRVEDCRLVNLLLWAEGARKEARFRVKVHDGRVTSVRSPQYVSLDLARLGTELGSRENEGVLRVRRYDAEDDALWLEIQFDRPPIDLSPITDRQSTKADFWHPGALIFNQEDGSCSLTTVPALFRSWGGVCLPVAHAREAVRRRRHRDTSVDALVAAALADLDAARQAPFEDFANRLSALNRRFVNDADGGAYLDALGLPFPNEEARQWTMKRVSAGRPTLYRVVTCSLASGRKTEVLTRRLKLAIAVGRMVWGSGGGSSKSMQSGARRDSAPPHTRNVAGREEAAASSKSDRYARTTNPRSS